VIEDADRSVGVDGPSHEPPSLARTHAESVRVGRCRPESEQRTYDIGTAPDPLDSFRSAGDVCLKMQLVRPPASMTPAPRRFRPGSTASHCAIWSQAPRHAAGRIVAPNGAPTRRLHDPLASRSEWHGA
jgi:hypothetical protein